MRLCSHCSLQKAERSNDTENIFDNVGRCAMTSSNTIILLSNTGSRVVPSIRSRLASSSIAAAAAISSSSLASSLLQSSRNASHLCRPPLRYPAWKRMVGSSSSSYFSSMSTLASTTYDDHSDNEEADSDSMTILMKQDFQRHGFKLANINPLYKNGFISDKHSIQESLPARMAPLVNILDRYRHEEEVGKTLSNYLIAHRNDGGDDKDSCYTLMETEEELHRLISKYFDTGIGYEIDHCSAEVERQFFMDYQYNHDHHPTTSELLSVYEQLLRVEGYTNLLSKRYTTARRFGIEGLEGSIPLINTIINEFATYDITNKNKRRVLLGTQHRGRVDFLHHILQLPVQDLIKQFDTANGPTFDDICRGYHNDIVSRNSDNNVPVHITLPPIPAHLEAMGSVVAGIARAHIRHRGNKDASKKQTISRRPSTDVLPITIHGDSSICGQGVVQETLQLGLCKNYNCDGTIRIILNNQIGYTTEYSKLQTHDNQTQSSDIVKSINAPILHVNATNLLDVLKASKIAVQYRQQFGKDIIINLWGWRLHGHNELDNPIPTNNELYNRIDQRLHSQDQSSPSYSTSIGDTFIDNIMANNVVEMTEDLKSSLEVIKSNVETEFQILKRLPHHSDDHANGNPDHTHPNASRSASSRQVRLLPKRLIKHTGVSKDLFEEAAKSLCSKPPSSTFQLHPQVEKLIETRRKMLLQSGYDNADANYDKNPAESTTPIGIDWATSELLALKTLQLQGINTRFSGEDVERGTFNQRHAVYHNMNTNTNTNTSMKNGGNDDIYCPLSSSSPSLTTASSSTTTTTTTTTPKSLGTIDVCNSTLSELGILGFEYGYSLVCPSNTLVMWESQFGDFVNGCQVLLDTIICCGYEKWSIQSPLTILLPHGYDGMGSEHSSSRIERFLQLFSSNVVQHAGRGTTGTGETGSNNSISDNNEDAKYESCNMIVAYPSTPANYFHLLRRQMKFQFGRRPLIVLTPKRTLRLGEAASPISEYIIDVNDENAGNVGFQPIIDDPRFAAVTTKECDPNSVRDIVLCSGEIYYDLIHILHSNEHGFNDGNIAIVRLEEIAPFPKEELRNLLETKYPNTKSIVWVQEEPYNQGCRQYVMEQLKEHVLVVKKTDSCSHDDDKNPKLMDTTTIDVTVSCISRPESSITAIGHPTLHHLSQQQLLNDVVEWCCSTSKNV